MDANRSYPNWEGTERKNQNFPYGPNQAKLNGLMQLQSDPICSSAGCSQYKHPDPPAEPPRDYPVPDFGEDPDIAGTIENERVSSKIVGHNWKFKTPESWEKYRNKAKDTDYNFAPELDEDTRTTIANAANAATRLGGWQDLV